DAGKMNLGLGQVGGACLVVSQFTLYGSVKDGNRPGFSYAARPEVAEPLYERFVAALRAQGVPGETGRFGAMLEVELVNGGPTTIWIDSDEVFAYAPTRAAGSAAVPSKAFASSMKRRNRYEESGGPGLASVWNCTLNTG